MSEQTNEQCPWEFSIWIFSKDFCEIFLFLQETDHKLNWVSLIWWYDYSFQAIVLMGSPSDEDYCKKIAKHCKELGLICQLRITSAHKGTEETLKILEQYEGMWLILYVGLSKKVSCIPNLRIMLWRHRESVQLCTFSKPLHEMVSWLVSCLGQIFP